MKVKTMYEKMHESTEASSKPEASEKPWKGICCSRCFNALSDKTRCKCRCRGEHHGRGKQLTAESGVESKPSVPFDR